MLHGPLEDRHRELGASFAEFGGWLMPVSYAGTVAEHTATRNAVGLFDVSHLGKALVRGPGAAQFVNSALTNDLDRIQPGKAQYTLCCNESGGVIDDLIAYYVGPDEMFLVPNAANTAAVVAALQDAAPAGLTITDEHRSYAVLAVQGPRSTDVLTELGLPTDMDYMGYADADASRACRCGCAAADTPASTATSCCRRGTPPGWCSTRCWPRSRGRTGSWPGWARATRCAPRWVIRCTVTNSPPNLAAAGPLRLGDRLEEGRVLRPRRAAGRESRRARGGCCGVCAQWVAACCGRT